MRYLLTDGRVPWTGKSYIASDWSLARLDTLGKVPVRLGIENKLK